MADNGREEGKREGKAAKKQRQQKKKKPQQKKQKVEERGLRAYYIEEYRKLFTKSQENLNMAEFIKNYIVEKCGKKEDNKFIKDDYLNNFVINYNILKKKDELNVSTTEGAAELTGAEATGGSTDDRGGEIRQKEVKNLISDLIKLLNPKDKTKNYDEDSAIRLIEQLKKIFGNLNFKFGKYKDTLLHWAVAYRRLAIVKFLLENGASSQIGDIDGDTPLHIAAQYGKLDIAQLLIKEGANINKKNGNGKTPLDIAFYYEKTNLIDFLKSKGGKKGSVTEAAEEEARKAVEEAEEKVAEEEEARKAVEEEARKAVEEEEARKAVEEAEEKVAEEEEAEAVEEAVATAGGGGAKPETVPAPTLCENYRKLYNIYCKRYRPPAWVEKGCEKILREHGDEAYLLYFESDDLDDVQKLAKEREPVNIAMSRYYDEDELFKTFRYKRGAYGELSKNGTKLPPQIAIACKTPIRNVTTGEEKILSVVSIIGFAFDNPEQPDYKYFKTNNGGVLDVDSLKKSMVKSYLLAFQAAKTMGKTTLAASPIGDGAFRPQEYTQEEFREEVVFPAMEEASIKFPGITLEKPIYKPGDRNHFDILKSFFNGSKWSEDLENTLFVNAWDCWSMLGNGNFADNSADGFWGRTTAISLLGWPLSNNLKSRPVKVNQVYLKSLEPVVRTSVKEEEEEKEKNILASLLEIISEKGYQELDVTKKTKVEELITRLVNKNFTDFNKEVEFPYQNIMEELYPPVTSPARLEKEKPSGEDKPTVLEEEIRVSNIEKNTPFRNPYFLSPDERDKLGESGVSKDFLQFSSIENFTLESNKFPSNTETFNWIKIAGDGACLFNSVVQFIFGSHFDDISQILREKVVDKAITTLRDFIIGEYGTIKDYKEIMGKRSTFAGDIEINGLMDFFADKEKLENFLSKVPIKILPRFKPGKETKIYVITPDIRGNLEWYGLFKPDDVMTGNDINRIFIFYNGYSHFELLLQGNLTEEGAGEGEGGTREKAKETEKAAARRAVTPYQAIRAAGIKALRAKKAAAAKSPLKLKNPKSKFLSPTSKIKKERKKKKDKINKLKKNLKK